MKTIANEPLMHIHMPVIRGEVNTVVWNTLTDVSDNLVKHVHIVQIASPPPQYMGKVNINELIARKINAIELALDGLKGLLLFGRVSLITFIRRFMRTRRLRNI